MPARTSWPNGSQTSCSTGCAATRAECLRPAPRAGHGGEPVRAVLVVNPFASRVTEARLAAVERELSRVVELTVLMTERPRHATELVTEACRGGCEVLIVFSGDGGFNEALNGLEGDVPIGFLPGGGTSVLPRALGLPSEPVAAAVQLAGGSQQGRSS